MKRRQFLTAIGGVLLSGWPVSRAFAGLFNGAGPKKEYPVTMSDEEWKAKLDPDAYRVLRQHGTEPAFTSPLNDEKRKGAFLCAGCHQELFSSDAKFDSGTGWPSFYKPASETAVGQSTDFKIGYPRTEVHCARCGGHLGHVFDDGPAPTGKRFCMNGAALIFKPAE